MYTIPFNLSGHFDNISFSFKYLEIKMYHNYQYMQSK